MMLGKIGNPDHDDSMRIIHKALDAGINFIDTADAYSKGESEEIVGKAINDRRDSIVLATKAHHPMGDDPNMRGNSRRWLTRAVEDSLRRLGTDYIDLYQIHGFDALTPWDETLRALDDLVRAGKVRYLGASNLAAWQLMKALGISQRDRLARFETLQAYYSLAGRDLERELVPLMESERVGLLVWSPLAGGFLSGKFTRNQKGPEGARRASFNFPPVNEERAFAVVDVLDQIAKARGVSVARLALAWLLHRPFTTSVIIGARNDAQLKDNLAAADVKLTSDELQRIDVASALPPEYPGWMITVQARDRLEVITPQQRFAPVK